MKAFLLLCTLCVALAVPLDQILPAVHLGLVEEVNSQDLPWKASQNRFFEGKTLAQAERLMGYKPNYATKAKAPRSSFVVDDIPDTYDASQQFPHCPTIGHIYNQADCGSCWAFGCVESAQDRMCIQTDGKSNISLSFFDLVTCGPDSGCDGGDPMDAWSYVAESGLVTASCSPYDIPTCPPAQQPCLNFVPTPPCVQHCNDSETWASVKHVALNAYYVGNGTSSVEAIQSEILVNGPVEACFTVYQDFLAYKSGVYVQNSQDALGGHCIKVIGWGTENGTPYWLCNNSWTTYWGDNGQFKIRRGTDECGIEDDVVAGMWVKN